MNYPYYTSLENYYADKHREERQRCQEEERRNEEERRKYQEEEDRRRRYQNQLMQESFINKKVNMNKEVKLYTFDYCNTFKSDMFDLNNTYNLYYNTSNIHYDMFNPYHFTSDSQIISNTFDFTIYDEGEIEDKDTKEYEQFYLWFAICIMCLLFIMME